MISKRCDHCGKRVPVGAKCSCISPQHYASSSNDKYTQETKLFYQTQQWEKARDVCITRCYGLDLYSFYALGIIEYGQTVHHIVPIIDDYSKRLDINNLIYLTESNHRIIHEMYKSDFEKTAQMLRGYVKMFYEQKFYRLPSFVNAKF